MQERYGLICGYKQGGQSELLQPQTTLKKGNCDPVENQRFKCVCDSYSDLQKCVLRKTCNVLHKTVFFVLVTCQLPVSYRHIFLCFCGAWWIHRNIKKTPKNQDFSGFVVFSFVSSLDRKINVCITPNAYFTAFFDCLSVTRLLRIFSQTLFHCFIIIYLL